MSPSSFRGVAIAMNAARGNRWQVRDNDFQIEFYFRDPTMRGNRVNVLRGVGASRHSS